MNDMGAMYFVFNCRPICQGRSRGFESRVPLFESISYKSPISTSTPTLNVIGTVWRFLFRRTLQQKPKMISVLRCGSNFPLEQCASVSRNIIDDLVLNGKKR